jgi:hypothetical protein
MTNEYLEPNHFVPLVRFSNTGLSHHEDINNNQKSGREEDTIYIFIENDTDQRNSPTEIDKLLRQLR